MRRNVIYHEGNKLQTRERRAEGRFDFLEIFMINLAGTEIVRCAPGRQARPTWQAIDTPSLQRRLPEFQARMYNDNHAKLFETGSLVRKFGARLCLSHRHECIAWWCSVKGVNHAPQSFKAARWTEDVDSKVPGIQRDEEKIIIAAAPSWESCEVWEDGVWQNFDSAQKKILDTIRRIHSLSTIWARNSQTQAQPDT